MVTDLFCAALTTICELVLPMIIRHITDTGLNDMASLTASLIGKMALLYLVLRILDCTANYYMADMGHGGQDRDGYEKGCVSAPAAVIKYLL